jgi:hypothetical protein
MFSLFHGLWQYLFRKPDVHILIIGLDHAGKTVEANKIFQYMFSRLTLPSNISAFADVVGENKINIWKARRHSTREDTSNGGHES